jgi:outer membrane protein assembly factor BamB
MSFPTNPSNGDTYLRYGRVYQYDSTLSMWKIYKSGISLNDMSDVDTATSTPVSGDTLIWSGSVFAPGPASGGAASYATIQDLPMIGHSDGDLALVTSTNTLYVSNSGGWFVIVLNTTAPVITGINSSYVLSSDGTPVVITGAVETPTGAPLTWSYTVSEGTLENNGGVTATISQVDNEFTITPTTNTAYAGIFNIDISVSDGISTDTITVTVNCLFGTVLLKHTYENANAFNSSTSDYFGRLNTTCMNDSYMVIVSYTENRIYVYDTTTRVLVTSYSAPIGPNALALSDNNKLVVGTTNGQSAYILDLLTGATLQTMANPNANTANTVDYFGFAVGISPNGSYAIVSAHREDDANGVDSGVAYIFDVTDGSLVYTLANPNIYGTGASDYFGYSVAISNSYASVGAYLEDNAGGTTSGALYIFDLADGSLKWSIDNPNTASTQANDYFAWSIAMTDTYVVAGAYGEDFPSGGDGVVYQFDIATGTLIHTLSGTSSAVSLGYSVNCYGNLIFAISTTETLAGAGGQGTAYLFDATTGNQLLQIGYPNTRDPNTPADQFGYYPAALTANYIVITAPNENAQDGSTNSGAAYVFDVTDGTLLERIDNPNLYGGSLNDYFGNNLSIGPSQVVIGAYQEDMAISGTVYADTGAAYQYNRNTGELQHTFLWPQYSGATQTGVRFGWATAANSAYSVVSAPYETRLNVDFPYLPEANPFTAPNDGLVYVFDRATGAQVTAITNPEPRGRSNSAGDVVRLNPYFGETLAMGDDMLAVGHPQSRGTTTWGVNYGKVYVYNTEDWSIRYTLTSKYTPVYQDMFGQAMSMYNKSDILTKTYNSWLNQYVSGNWLAVGGARSSTTYTGGGIYVHDAADGTLVKYIPGAAANNRYFGKAVSINSEYLAAGGYDSNTVTIYKLNEGTGWDLYRTFTTTSLGLPSGFGFQVEVTDDGKVIVGAYNANAAADGGRVYIIDIETSTLEATITSPNVFGTANSDEFGTAIAYNNGALVASALKEDDATGTTSGAAYQFSL